MLMTILIIINIGVIAYFGTIFVRLHEDLQFMNDDIADLKSQIKEVIERVELEKIKSYKTREKGDEFLGI